MRTLAGGCKAAVKVKNHSSRSTQASSTSRGLCGHPHLRFASSHNPRVETDAAPHSQTLITDILNPDLCGRPGDFCPSGSSHPRLPVILFSPSPSRPLLRPCINTFDPTPLPVVLPRMRHFISYKNNESHCNGRLLFCGVPK